MERTQFAPGLKLKEKYSRPYEVVRCIGQDRYELRKEGEGEGPRSTTSSADMTKPWRYSSSSGSDEPCSSPIEGYVKNIYKNNSSRRNPSSIESFGLIAD